jgi:homoaconitase/3-isopropylmalate dehydratase large subunit
MNDTLSDTYNESLKNKACKVAAKKEKLKIVEHTVPNTVKNRLSETLRLKQLDKIAKSTGTSLIELLQQHIQKQYVQINKTRKEEN